MSNLDNVSRRMSQGLINRRSTVRASPPPSTPSTDNNLSLAANGNRNVAQNRVAIGKTLAVLFCPAANGKMLGVTIDIEDLPRVQALGRWLIANFDRANGRINLYAYKKRRGRTIYLHRLILNAPADRRVEVDHIHHRNLDNRKSEIRLTTKSVNQRNKRPRALWPSLRLSHEVSQ